MKITVYLGTAVLLLAGLVPFSRSQGVVNPRSVITAAGVAGISGGGNSHLPALSADGRFVAFVSAANNLVTNDNQGPWLDVFVRDLVLGSTKLVSVRRTGQGGANGDSVSPNISSRGQLIAFESTATNLVGNDTNRASDIFVRDMLSDDTLLVSENMDGTASGNGASTAPVSTPDGLSIAFESAASNLVPDDTNTIVDVFVRDLLSESTWLVSAGANSNANRNARSFDAAISADARQVAFVSTATGLVPGVTNILGEIYVRDLESGVTYWASTNVGNLISWNHRCLNPAISEDGRVVVFKVLTNSYNWGGPVSNGSPVFVCRHDLETGTTLVIGTNSLELTWPAISTDGRYVAYEESGVCGVELLRYDAQTGSNLLVSVDLSGAVSGAGDASTPVMTPDGSKVAFLFACVPRDPPNCTGGPLTTNAVNQNYQLYLRDIAQQTTRLLSVHPDGSGSSGMDDSVPTLSADGRRVAFETLDNELVNGDNNRASDVFACTAPANTLQLVSRCVLPSQTSVGLHYLTPNTLSADGRFAVFSSLDGNVVPNDTNGCPDVFVRDLLTGSNALVSVRTNLPPPLRIYPARDPVISANGQYAAYLLRTSPVNTLPPRGYIYWRDLVNQNTMRIDMLNASNVIGNCSGPTISGDGRKVAFYAQSGVYVRDTRLPGCELASVNWTGSNAAVGAYRSPMLSRDGQWLLFESKATDLTTRSCPPDYWQLYARDLGRGVTIRLTQTELGGAFPADSRAVAFNPGGRCVLFTTAPGWVYVRDLQADTNTPVCSSGYNPAMSGDGRWVAYEATNGAPRRQIWLKDLQTGTETLVSVNASNAAPGNDKSFSPLLSYDGRYVVFASKARDLVLGDTNDYSDIFVRDTVFGQTLQVTVNPQSGAPGLGTSARLILGADGRSVVFQSFAPDLVLGDYNQGRDIFVLRLSAGDSDGDGLEDDWELAYFGSLARDGTGDFDGDGLSDHQEFAAGTDPTNQGSVFRVLTLSAPGSSTLVFWSAVPGRRYRVEYKTNLTDSAWQQIPGLITAPGSTASAFDTNGLGGQRFYRVVTE